MKRSDFLKSLATVFAAPALLAAKPIEKQEQKELPKPKPDSEIILRDLIRDEYGYLFLVVSVTNNMATCRSVDGSRPPITIPTNSKKVKVFARTFK
jgi:hypothetical protein